MDLAVSNHFNPKYLFIKIRSFLIFCLSFPKVISQLSFLVSPSLCCNFSGPRLFCLPHLSQLLGRVWNSTVVSSLKISFLVKM